MVVVAGSTVEIAQRFMLGDTRERLEDEVAEMVQLAEAPTWTLMPEWHQIPGLDHEAADQLIDPMLLRLENVMKRESTDNERVFFDAAAWLLGLEVDPLPTLPRAVTAAKRLEQRLGASDYSVISPIIDARISYLRTRERWPAADPATRLGEILRFYTSAHDNQRCYLLSIAGEDILSNVSDPQPLDLQIDGLRPVQVNLTDSVLSTPSYCLVATQQFSGDIELSYGAISNDAVRAIKEIHDSRNFGVLVTLLLSLILASLLGRHFTRRLRAISEVTDEVLTGQLGSRIRVGEGNNDLDRVSRAINDMLDHIVSLMSGVKEVSDNITHDLRTPLTRLRNHIEFLSQQEQVDQAEIEKLGEEVDRMLETFSALLRISQLEQGGRRRSFVRFDLKQSLLDVVELYEPVFAESGLALNLDAALKSAYVRGDRDLWQQALSNLLENALTYAADGKSVDITLSERKQGFVVQVKDSGQGIPEADLDRVFERFVRLDRSRNSPGTGLGLSLVAAVCQAHNVDITLQNADGLLVTLTWPEAAL